VSRTAAVFFDVDFTLIQPGPRFQGVGYHEACARRGIEVEVSCFDAAVAGAAPVLEAAGEAYDAGIYVAYTRRIIELMGGSGAGVDEVAWEIYDEWNQHHHFTLYDDVPAALSRVRAMDIRVGLISNSQRCLTSFSTHFNLAGLIDVAISSAEHGYMKPHSSIFHAALARMQVPAADAVMVGDSLLHDVIGARRVGMRGVLLARDGRAGEAEADIPVIRTLAELPDVL
jgi:HAD superfamily hydrolase (TIGR01662 family)